RRARAVQRFALSLAGLCLLWGIVTAGRASGQAPRDPRIIRASGFVIVDAQGRERGSFGYNGVDHAGVLNLEREAGTRVNLGAGRGHVSMRMNHGKSDINMGYSEKAGTYFEMFDSQGKAIFGQRRP